jgi:predicted nuclease with TOPRIM domain
VESLREGYRDHSEVITAIKKDQAQQAAVVASIVSLKDQCARMNETLQLVRDDVIILKTRDQRLPLGTLGAE